jgi:uncharacterized protein DUF1214
MAAEEFTMNTSSPSPLVNRWQQFCDTLKTSGADILQSAHELDAVNQAESLRYLTRLTRGAIEKFVEYVDPLDPIMYKTADERTGHGGDNPDQMYIASPVIDSETYEIRGNRGTIWDFNFNIFSYLPDNRYELLGRLESKDLVSDANGDFSLVLGGERNGDNWLPLPPGANQVKLRQFFRDRDTEKPVVATIHRISATAESPPLSIEAISQRLEKAETYFSKTSKVFYGWTQDFLATSNCLPPMSPDFIAKGGGEPNACFYLSSWNIADDQALVIELPVIPIDQLWSMAIYNYWLESMDYVNFRIHTNSALARRNEDGSCTLVIANRDPGFGNWLNATGHLQGNMILRTWTGGEPVAEPQTRVVQLADTIN